MIMIKLEPNVSRFDENMSMFWNYFSRKETDFTPSIKAGARIIRSELQNRFDGRVL